MGDDNRELMYQDGVSRIYWNGELRCVEFESSEVSGTRTVDSKQIRETLLKVLDVIKEKRARKFLMDATNGTTVPVEDMLWMEKEWLPQGLKTGVKYTAVVVPKSLASHMVVDKLSDTVDPKAMTKRFFKDRETAREWLARQ